MFPPGRTTVAVLMVAVGATLSGCSPDGGTVTDAQTIGPVEASSGRSLSPGRSAPVEQDSSTLTARTPSGTVPTGTSPNPVASKTPSSTASTKTSAAGQAQTACVRETFQGMSRQERAGQVLMVGVAASRPSSAIGLVTKYQVGGIFLRGRSSSSVSSLRKQTDAVQAAARRAGVPALLIAADQEGGQVQTLSGEGFVELPSGRTQGTWSRKTLTSRTTASSASLRKAGINLNLAPVADVVNVAQRKANPPIGAHARDLGANPTAVAADVSTMVSAAQEAGVSTAIKHFPGLGRVRVNTDTSAGANDAVMRVEDPFLAPFAAGIDSGTRFVMISSASYPKLDPRNIAAFSRPITTDLLRGRLNFAGVAISDDLGAAKAVAGTPVGDRAVRFVGAGGDLVLTVRTGDVGVMRSALVAAAKKSPDYARRLDDAALRVLSAKVDAGVIACG